MLKLVEIILSAAKETPGIFNNVIIVAKMLHIVIKQLISKLLILLKALILERALLN